MLARAAELQGQATSPDLAGTLSDEQILELGREVGLSAESLRQAIAEERANVVIEPARGIAGWFGPAVFGSTRTVPGTPESSLIAIDAVLRGDLPFDVKRRFPDRVHWEPRRSFIEVVRSQFIRGIEGTDLKLAQEVATTVTTVDQARTHVRIDAMLGDTRRRAVSSAMNTAVFTVLAGVVVGVLGVSPLMVVPAVGAALVGIAASYRRGYRRTAARVVTAMEQVLDRLEFGPAKRRGGGIGGAMPGDGRRP